VKRKRECGLRMFPNKRIASFRRAADEDRLPRINLTSFWERTLEDRECVMEEVGEKFRRGVTQLEIEMRLSTAPFGGGDNSG
jgi:hypothetical protein